ncbi:MAG: polysaccharide deacetylase family protein [Nitrosomonas sp.]|jgi:peptidoglycan/xylan/chitin deacetylase (PgdA/CDA1 family)|nr:polysaccharide deacetylase family protein [Nitrosomonas sp.]MBP9099813.1 polysaccharide deacetylase family protein [Nitrosomonas sp.]
MVYYYNGLIRVSIVLHLLVICLFLIPDGWFYALFVMFGNHVVLVAQGLWPRSQWLGRNITHVPLDKAGGAVYLTIDDGPCPEVTPQVLQILEQYNAKATFFCIGKRVQQYPDLAKSIVAGGHKLENHSMEHSYTFSLWCTQKIYRDVVNAQTVIQQVTNVRPHYFRAPAGLRNIFLDAVLQKLGLCLVSWTRRGFDTRQRNASVVLDSLCRNLQAGDILLLHDGNAALTCNGRAVIVEVLPVLLQTLFENNLNPEVLLDGL